MIAQNIQRRLFEAARTAIELTFRPSASGLAVSARDVISAAARMLQQDSQGFAFRPVAEVAKDSAFPASSELCPAKSCDLRAGSLPVHVSGTHRNAPEPAPNLDS